MECKNCGHSLRRDFSYCPVCGAKVIHNRLTLKNIWQDISFQVFDLDNTILKTFRHMFTKPEVVVEGYIGGARKKYMNPISYFAIAITLSGLLFYILRNWYGINMTQNTINGQKGPDMDFIFDYQGLLSYLMMPIYALMTWILFLDKRKLNFTEHLVTNAYTTAQMSFVQFIVLLPLFGLFDLNYQSINWYVLLVMIGFQFYVFKRIHGIGIGSTIIRALAYVFLFFMVFMVIGIVIAIIGFMTGFMDIEDFRPK
ncbi:DUF3667 domain-containing protein [Croceivirga thetidis]|uniref:DUF3667 domain-containing protein n=1 Tax=Croceivirga thetidis TaxID=2721623 RepID=A0ABX1GWI0_9FLAO|nr:DUF3667 domain-containing protein [Croceivirga thetidis]NKI33072.1 DUF3667 domain-containing protein [Croceivirga thetidis]